MIGQPSDERGTGVHVPIRPKKVLFFGKTKARTRCTGALVDALQRNGLEVRWLNCSFLRRYFGKLGMQLIVRRIRKRFDPDICFVFYHDLPSSLMDEFSAEVPTIVWMEEQTQVDPEWVAYLRNVGLLCLSTPRLVRQFRAAGIADSTFLMSGFSPRYHRPAEISGGPKYDRDVAFIGAPGSVGDRPEFLAWLAGHHNLQIFGRIDLWLPYLRRYPQLEFVREVRASDYGEICARSRIVLGLNQDHHSSYYFSNRLFLTLGCSGFHLIHHVPGVEHLFADGEHLAWFHDRDECLHKITYYLDHEQERSRIARAGYELATREHQYEDRVRDILAILAGEQELSCPEELVGIERGDGRLVAALPLPTRRETSGSWGEADSSDDKNKSGHTSEMTSGRPER